MHRHGNHLLFCFKKAYINYYSPSHREEHTYREVRHWLVMNIPDSTVERGDEVFGYIGAGPPKNTGLHRYTFLIYKQPRGKIKHNENRTSNKYALENGSTD